MAGGGDSTSYPNYVNVAVADLCFQMFAEVKDVDQLLDMIRSSTDLRDYIRFDLNGDGDTNDNYNGQPESQPLILMNPAGFFIMYLMPDFSSLSVKLGEAAVLEKGYYKGVVFNIPGAEVFVEGQWLAFSDKNKEQILAQNPFTLKWRVNADLLRKLGYNKGDTVTGSIIAVDDQWNGLSLTKEVTIEVRE